MKTEQINIRDPYVLAHNGKYYLYGTGSETGWGEAFGFDCFVSENLQDWEGPVDAIVRLAKVNASRRLHFS